MTERRSRARVGAAAALVLLGGCLHTHRVREGNDQQEAGAPEGKHEEGASPRATRKRVPPRDGRPAVAASPEGLMNPGSARKIQQALHDQGYLRDAPSGQLDEPTSAALREFQRRHDLAETGAPDRETLRTLGIDPSDVYKTAPGGAS